MPQTHWSAAVLAFVAATLLVGMALLASAALVSVGDPAQAASAAWPHWSDSVEAYASATLRAAPSPLSRW